MIYVFTCPSCGRQYEKTDRDFVGVCENTHRLVGDKVDDITLRRDYRAEHAEIQTFTSSLGDGKVETRVVEPGDDITPRR